MAPTKKSSVKDKALTGIGNLIKLLPTGTVFLYQFLSPLVTNNGHCLSPINKTLTAILVAISGVSCAFSCFTDSYVGSDGRVHYGVATKSGIWPSPQDRSMNVSKYKIRFGDFVHAFFSVFVFGVLVLLDSNTVGCFFPALVVSEKMMIMVLPTVVGVISSAVFAVYPSTRHGIGYPLPSEETDDDHYIATSEQ